MPDFLKRHRQFAVFVAGGLLCAVIDVGLMQLLIAGGINYQLATSAGFGAGLLVNYVYHARLTFGAAATSFNFVRFLCVVALNYLLTMLCVHLAVVLGAGALAGKLVSLPLVAVNGFILSKYWTFK
jgi:putative flippase GtrA